MIQAAINRYKRMRTERFLRQTYQYQYAFVGMGQHSLTNLYPVLHYLGLPLKYICVTSGRKAKLIEQKYPHVIATTSLDEILNDKAVKGVFVSASPSAHFSIASQVLQSRKSLFIEKPPLPDTGRTRCAHRPATAIWLTRRNGRTTETLRPRRTTSETTFTQRASYQL